MLEPFQTALTIENKIKEVYNILEEYGSIPIIMIGFSGGNPQFHLYCLVPAISKKTHTYREWSLRRKHASNIMKTRMRRLGNNDMESSIQLTKTLDNPSAKNRNEALCSFGELMSKADTYDPLPHEDELLDCRYEVLKGVWEEAGYLRRSVKLLELGSKIQIRL